MKTEFFALVLAAAALASQGDSDYPIRSAELGKVKVTRGFWHDRLETNRVATLTTDFAKCNETPRIANFTNAANRAVGTFGGIPFDDSDVFKVMEGAAYIYAEHPDPELKKYMDWLIGQIAGAQERDGYLYTARTLGLASSKDPKMEWMKKMMGPDRWTNIKYSHEFYNLGHMYEAAVAWHLATGETNFLAVAKKSFNLLNRTFGPADDQLKDTSGHQEIELALCKMYRVTGEKKYLDLCRFFLDMRGRKDLRPDADSADRQDHKPVLEQEEAIGHAVRAAYLYCGMADYAALSGDKAYVDAIKKLWENVVSKKMHVNGGIGARQHFEHPVYGYLGEAFNDPYDLPNDAGQSYMETCAQIGFALWNDRMFRWTGEAKYMDVLERTVYNGFASGISLSGDEFFYPNPLASTNGYKRSKWFGCSCCPVNDVRFIPQIPSFAYATDGKDVYVNIFIEGAAEIAGMRLAVKTDYPWSGDVEITVLEPSSRRILQVFDSPTLKLRLPGWACGRPVPSDLYGQLAPSDPSAVRLSVNGKPVGVKTGADGYLALSRSWKAGDIVKLSLPMDVKLVKAHPEVKQDLGKVVVERGPILFCAEAIDNTMKVYDATLPKGVTFREEKIAIGDKTFPALKASNGLTLVPYCIWGNRAPGQDLQTWFRVRE